ncbi:MAG: hypothetical protein QXT88_02785 [Desulfurococcaceae archaeon]|uniref:Dinitrogenase iron-molybdenum cofactor biosynthesis domain-containing protein n=1 Tax=Staphylothermus marinus TaxID=2280 RepID=A0A7C4H6B5_STAMA
MNTLLVSINNNGEIVGYEEADYITVFEMESRKMIRRFQPNQMNVLEDIIEASDSCILVTTSISSEKLLEIEEYGVKVIFVDKKDLRDFLNEIF